MQNFCKTYANKPLLKVAGLNPHAGEEGILGSEEKDWIKNAVTTWGNQNKGVHVLGPISPDTCWNSSSKAWRDKTAPTHDGILAMYHDQGLIPIKVIALNYSVNTTIGLPFIRTSPDHGTGFDIAGKGLAQSQSMVEAIKAAFDLLKIHDCLTRINTCPNSTGVPFSTRISTISALNSDSISFINFIASSMQIVCPIVILLPKSTNGSSPGAAAL